MPSAFAALGMTCGIKMMITCGFVSISTAYLAGQVTLKHPTGKSFPDPGRLLLGEKGYWVVIPLNG
jgi:amino acid permease